MGRRTKRTQSSGSSFEIGTKPEGFGARLMTVISHYIETKRNARPTSEVIRSVTERTPRSTQQRSASSHRLSAEDDVHGCDSDKDKAAIAKDFYENLAAHGELLQLEQFASSLSLVLDGGGQNYPDEIFNCTGPSAPAKPRRSVARNNRSRTLSTEKEIPSSEQHGKDITTAALLEPNGSSPESSKEALSDNKDGVISGAVTSLSSVAAYSIPIPSPPTTAGLYAKSSYGRTPPPYYGGASPMSSVKSSASSSRTATPRKPLSSSRADIPRRGSFGSLGKNHGATIPYNYPEDNKACSDARPDEKACGDDKRAGSFDIRESKTSVADNDGERLINGQENANTVERDQGFRVDERQRDGSDGCDDRANNAIESDAKHIGGGLQVGNTKQRCGSEDGNVPCMTEESTTTSSASSESGGEQLFKEEQLVFEMEQEEEEEEEEDNGDDPVWEKVKAQLQRESDTVVVGYGGELGLEEDDLAVEKKQTTEAADAKATPQETETSYSDWLASLRQTAVGEYHRIKKEVVIKDYNERRKSEAAAANNNDSTVRRVNKVTSVAMLNDLFRSLAAGVEGSLYTSLLLPSMTPTQHFQTQQLADHYGLKCKCTSAGRDRRTLVKRRQPPNPSGKTDTTPSPPSTSEASALIRALERLERRRGSGKGSSSAPSASSWTDGRRPSMSPSQQNGPSGSGTGNQQRRHSSSANNDSQSQSRSRNRSFSGSGQSASSTLPCRSQSMPKASPAVVVSGSPLDESNVGFGLLKRMGWRDGDGLGADGSGRVDPVGVHFKADKAGLGYSQVPGPRSTKAIG
mmetsp:Transcript_39016/g.63221  ORF Transcript_39016/g.63221 Transcript_39016/m.63221 type:complete len:803 (+) Transcript_39016:408-2816(+)